MFRRSCSVGLLTVILLLFWLPAQAASPVVLVWGDSLSAAYGIPLERGWVALMQKKMRASGYPHKVVNGSVSGETTAGGLRRLPEALERHQPDLVLIELGGNDGLRGLPLAKMRDNLSEMVRMSREAGAEVLVFQMMIPPNYGPDYSSDFSSSFHRVAEAEGADFIPFFLRDIAMDESNFLPDGIHPNERAQPLLLERVWPVVERRLTSARDQG